MKILYDHQIFSTQTYGGISRYYVELIKNIRSGKAMGADLPILITNNHYLLEADMTKCFALLPKLDIKGKKALVYGLNSCYARRYLKHGEFDIFHPTYYDPYFLKYIRNKPFVLTVYDMIHEKYPEYFSKNDHTRERKKYLIGRASKIIAISNSTKNDVMDIYGVPENKIVAIHLACSGGRNESQSDDLLWLPEKFILFVGNRQGYKNFELFAGAISSMLQKDRDTDVVCIGGGAFTKKEKLLFDALKISGQLHQFNISDDLLPKVYGKALFFIFPSLYEGFGIPILESFMNNCPVLCSDASSFPEVAGGAAIYFDPKSADSIKGAVTNALNNPALLDRLRSKALERLANFSWEKTARKTEEIYKSVVLADRTTK